MYVSEESKLEISKSKNVEFEEALEETVVDLCEESKFVTSKRQNVEFEEALEATRFGKYNIYLILTCGLLIFVSSVETYSVGYIVPAATCELNLDSYTKGILTSCTTTGITVSSVLWGFLSDIKGRRKLLILTLILAFVSGEVASIVPSFWGFAFLRFINGICTACPWSICFVYLGEFLSTKSRDKSIAWATTFVGIDLLYLSSMGWPLLQKTIDIRFLGLRLTNWRVYMLINSLPNIMACFCLLQFPESPKYLYCIGKTDEALKILKKIYSFNTGNSEDSYPIESLDQRVFLEKSFRSKRGALKDITDQISPLFKPPLLVYTFAACAIQAGNLAISSGLFFWYPDIVNQVTKSRKDSVTVCEALSGVFAQTDAVQCDNTVEDRVFILNLIVGGYYTVGYAVWGTVVGMLGIKTFFITLMAASTVSTLLTCFLSQKILINVFFISALTLPGIGVSVMNAWVIEIFPTQVAGTALSTVITIGMLGSAIASSVVGIMLEWNCLVTFGLFALTVLVCLVLSLLLPYKRLTSYRHQT